MTSGSMPGRYSRVQAWAHDTLIADRALNMHDYILEYGKLADLIIPSDNPIEVDHEAIFDIQVSMTMVRGKVEHCAQEREALCP